MHAESRYLVLDTGLTNVASCPNPEQLLGLLRQLAERLRRAHRLDLNWYLLGQDLVESQPVFLHQIGIPLDNEHSDTSARFPARAAVVTSGLQGQPTSQVDLVGNPHVGCGSVRSQPQDGGALAELSGSFPLPDNHTVTLLC